MTKEYAAEQRKRHLKETAQIQAFLAAPENSDLLQLYESVVDEFQFIPDFSKREIEKIKLRELGRRRGIGQHTIEKALHSCVRVNT
jgi:hypothetical protein